MTDVRDKVRETLRGLEEALIAAETMHSETARDLHVATQRNHLAVASCDSLRKAIADLKRALGE